MMILSWLKKGSFLFGQLQDSFYYADWTEESFLADSGHKEIVSRSFDFSKLKSFILIIFAALLILIVRAVWLQLMQNGLYSSLSEDNRLRAEAIEPKRGIIYTRDLQPLVRNTANFVLYFRPIDLPSDELTRDNLCGRLARFWQANRRRLIIR